MPLETCWAFNERWINKFYYKVASCWLFLLILTAYIIQLFYSICTRFTKVSAAWITITDGPRYGHLCINPECMRHFMFSAFDGDIVRNETPCILVYIHLLLERSTRCQDTELNHCTALANLTQQNYRHCCCLTTKYTVQPFKDEAQTALFKDPVRTAL